MKLLPVIVFVCVSLQLCNSLFLKDFILPKLLKIIAMQKELEKYHHHHHYHHHEPDHDHHDPHHDPHHVHHHVPHHEPHHEHKPQIFDPHFVHELHQGFEHQIHYNSPDHYEFPVSNLIRHYKNNACHHPEDYDTIATNEHCWYNPDADLTVPQIIQRHDYPLEIHSVTTEDGFYLQLFRIPYGRYNDTKNITDKQPVLLQHGIFTSSATWVFLGNRSLAFILAEKGYDVWLANSRGTTYSKGHANYSTSNPKYWDWSWTEMGLYDLPASLDVIIDVNGRNDVIYIGQSLGTNLPYVYGTTEPEEARNRMSLIVNLAPTLFLGHIKTKFKVWSQYLDSIELLGHKKAKYEFLPQSPEFKSFLEKKCLHSADHFHFCVDLLFEVFGADYEQFIPETLTLIISHFPAGTSLKNFLHLGQSINSDDFCPYDYGKYRNIFHYAHSHPPSYNLSTMLVPSYIMYGENDYTGTEHGAKLLYSKLPNDTRVGLYKIKNPLFSHVDFVFAKDVVCDVYDEMLKVMEKY